MRKRSWRIGLGLVVASLLTGLAALSAGNAQAAPTPTSAGTLTVTAAGAYPQYNGMRLQSPGQPEIFLVIDGTLRLIPDEQTYNNLFVDWTGIHQVVGIENITRGSDLSYGAVLARTPENATVYLVSNYAKRAIPSATVFNKYYFNWNKVVIVPRVVLEAVWQDSDLS